MTTDFSRVALAVVGSAVSLGTVLFSDLRDRHTRAALEPLPEVDGFSPTPRVRAEARRNRNESAARHFGYVVRTAGIVGATLPLPLALHIDTSITLAFAIMATLLSSLIAGVRYHFEERLSKALEEWHVLSTGGMARYWSFTKTLAHFRANNPLAYHLAGRTIVAKRRAARIAADRAAEAYAEGLRKLLA